MARKMKDSGIEWIREIPEGWEVVPVKRLCTMQAGKNLTSEQIAPEGTYPVYGGNGIRGFFSDYNCVGQFLTVGHQGALCGNVHKINGKVWATEHAVITAPSSYAILDFLYYLLIGMDLNQYVSSTAAQPGLAVGTLLNLKTCYPCSTLEQTQISNYLNAKCSEIDTMLSRTRSSIEEYKKLKQAVITQAVTKGVRGEREMKNSKIEWVGNIPIDWNTIKLKYCTYIRARLGWKALKADEYVEIGFPFLSAFNIVNNTLQFTNLNYINQFRYDESPEIQLSNGDVLLVKDGAGIGKCAIVENMPMPSTVNGSIAVVSVTNSLIPKYLYYYFLSKMFQQHIDLLKDGMGVPHLFQSDLKEIKIAFPSKDEQKEIADYLDGKCAEIDKLIAKKEQLVKELENYKKSLIYEVVTGKREV